jgi:hypothetical protein
VEECDAWVFGGVGGVGGLQFDDGLVLHATRWALASNLSYSPRIWLTV